jgi:hypothetical protein
MCRIKQSSIFSVRKVKSRNQINDCWLCSQIWLSCSRPSREKVDTLCCVSNDWWPLAIQPIDHSQVGTANLRSKATVNDHWESGSLLAMATGKMGTFYGAQICAWDTMMNRIEEWISEKGIHGQDDTVGGPWRLTAGQLAGETASSQITRRNFQVSFAHGWVKCAGFAMLTIFPWDPIIIPVDQADRNLLFKLWMDLEDRWEFKKSIASEHIEKWNWTIVTKREFKKSTAIVMGRESLWNFIDRNDSRATSTLCRITLLAWLYITFLSVWGS